jgi:DNA-directed RNA polymerase sigma subunit (sigma70/sigma32)
MKLKPETEKRYKYVLRMRRKGLTYALIGEKIGGVSRQRVEQIYLAALRWESKERIF